MERLITDIGQYGTMIEQATAALDEPIDTNTEYRDRQRQMYTDYQAAWDSQGRDSHRAFLRMINDPDQRAEFEADVAAVAEALPALDPALRKVMAGFFELVGHQIDEVERIQQRCAQRVKRFTAFGTMEQSRGVARQLNEAIGAARALLKSSFTDSRLDIDVPLARHAISSVGALSFKIGDLSNPKPAKPADTEVDLTSFAALTTQVDAPAMSDMLNTRHHHRARVAARGRRHARHRLPRPRHRAVVLGPQTAQPRRHRVDHRPLPLTGRPRPRNRRSPFDVHRTHHHPRRSRRVTTDSRHRLLLPAPGRPDRPPTRPAPAALRRRRLRTARPRLLGPAAPAHPPLHQRRSRRRPLQLGARIPQAAVRPALRTRPAAAHRRAAADGVAFVEQARYESARGIKLLRREPLGTYDSILALHLAQMMRASGGQTVLISREEMHGLFSGVLNDTDRDAVTFAARIDGAIARLTGLEILRKSRDDEDSYTISPVITAIMTASVITELQQQFEQLLNGGAPQDAEEDVDSWLNSSTCPGCRSSTGACSTATTPSRSAAAAR